MSPLSLKRLILASAATVAVAIAFWVGHATDPVRPFMLALGLLLVLKLNLEYLLGLPMGVTYPVATPRERGARKRLLVGSWLLAGFIFWVYASQ